MRSVILIILDGFGVTVPSKGNAISQAKPANLTEYLHLFPSTTLKASGEAVGLPAGEVGSTEVGHLNIGAGKIVYQSLPRINLSIADATFYKNEALLASLDHCRKNKSVLHLIGLVSPGIVHSSIEHLFALLFLCKEQNFADVIIHVITDGRDSPPKAALEYTQNLSKKISELGIGTIGSVMGRYYGMDRDKRWERTQKAYQCLTQGVGNNAPDLKAAIEASYKAGKTDEFIEPTLIHDENLAPRLIAKGDAVIFYNFRIDRPRQLTKAFVLKDFQKDANKTSYDPFATKYYKKHEVVPVALTPPFERGKKIDNLFFVTMTEYEKDLPVSVAFPPKPISMPLGRVIAENKLKQLRMAESEKERFVTFYFNGLRDNPFDGEERIIVPSPKVATYDKKPEMSAFELTDQLIKKIGEKRYSFILVNFANPDMVGHTGNLRGGIRAVEVVDECVGRIVKGAISDEVTILITGDHGNIEEMIDSRTGNASTEHSINPVYLIAINNSLKGKNITLQTGILADVAPTVISLLGLMKPADMTGRNLLEDITG